MNIAIIVNPEKDIDFSVSSGIVKYLCEKGATVYADRQIEGSVFTDKSDAVSRCDVIVTVGGDGTILKVVNEAYKYDKPILAVNLGTVGYMAAMEPFEYDKLDSLLSGDYGYVYRSVLSVSAGNDEKLICKDIVALNDAVISHGIRSQIINLELFCNGTSITSYRADGLIFATPTGSTAYSLSAGGPIIDTELEAIEVTPICAHSFNGRSILFKDTAMLEVASVSGKGNAGYLTVDGIYNYKLEPEDTVKIRLAEKKIRTVTFDRNSFYNILSTKIR